MMRKFRFLTLFLLPFVILAIPATSHAQVAVGISVRIGPPPLPVYAQPICPGPRYIWVPGYWAYGDDGYYWVPGTWVLAPRPGFLWTPGYWGFADGVYLWHRGYWGPHVGFYGGINYGYGYPGAGFYGGEWRHGEFFYNRSVTNVNINIVHNVYERRVNERFESRASFNGRGGIEARPNRQEMAYDHERHFDPTPEQEHHRDEAAHDRNQWQSVNHGRPGFAATPRAGDFSHRDMGQPGNRDSRMNQNRDNRMNQGRPNRGNGNMDRGNRGQQNRQNRQMNGRQGGRNNGNKGDRREKPQKQDRKPHGPGRDRGRL
ncbi:MAG TPA: hypothetical protein VGR93_03440 [Candidatus Acidoferrales bacterium]|nr:hypothetical protein [Candidatus Acidoferrales bacterium]